MCRKQYEAEFIGDSGLYRIAFNVDDEHSGINQAAEKEFRWLYGMDDTQMKSMKMKPESIRLICYER